MSILDWLGIKASPAPDAEGSAGERAGIVRHIAAELDALDPDQARRIASFAYILGRVAHAEDGISEEEAAEMERIVADLGDLPEDHAAMVVEMARTHAELFAGTDNFLVTRDFAERASREQKMSLLECLFAVSASDGTVSAREDAEIRKIAAELKLTHQDFIAARTIYREYLGVLKPGLGGQE